MRLSITADGTRATGPIALLLHVSNYSDRTSRPRFQLYAGPTAATTFRSGFTVVVFRIAQLHTLRVWRRTYLLCRRYDVIISFVFSEHFKGFV